VVAPGVYHVHVMKTGGTSLARTLDFALEDSFPTPGHVGARQHEKFSPQVLVAMPPVERARFAFVSTHMPAWVGEELFPDHLRVTVLRDPVERTISHLRQIAGLAEHPVELEELYDDPVWHARLVDHQVQVFGASRAEFEADAPTRRSYGPSEVRAAFMTSIGVPRPVDEHVYAAAVARLDRVDEVGVTERLAELVDRLEARLARPLGALRYERVSEDRGPGPASLRRRIERENGWDRMLYERALAVQR
jgi:hypothetical protein